MSKNLLFKTIFLLLFCILPLTGCIRVNEEIWINQDNSGKLLISIGVSEQLLALAQNNNSQGNIIDKIPGEINQNLSPSNPFIKNINIQDEIKDGYKYKTYTADITDLEKFFQTGENNTYSISEMDNGDLLFKQTIPKVDNVAPNSPNDLGTNLAKAAFAGDYFKVIIHVNDVVNTNGTLNSDKNIVEWDIPILDLANSTTSTELSIEYKVPWYISVWKFCLSIFSPQNK